MCIRDRANGCAKVDSPLNATSLNRTSLTLPKTRIAIDAVALDLGVSQLDSSQAETFEEFWGLLDQQELPLERRRNLDQNGLRVAVMSANAPPVLNELLEDQKIDPALMNEFEKQLNAKGLMRPQPRMLSHQRISNREGQAHKVDTSEIHSEASWIIESGESKTVGSGKLVHGVFSIRTYPQGDGSVRLVILPEIHHGAAHPRIGAGQGSFLVESTQNITPIDELKFEVILRSGETLVVAPTKDISEMGKIFFGSFQPTSALLSDLDKEILNKPVPTHRMLLIRVFQTQMDDLFSNSNLNEKLITNPSF